MTYQPPTPLEQHQLNPNNFAYGDRVVLPDGRSATISKTGYKYAWADADHGADWRGLLTELRPLVAEEIGVPRVMQLALF